MCKAIVMKMMMKTVVCLATIAIFSMKMAMAANYTVGAPNGGWDQSTDLATWASSQTFLTGDNLIFTYTINHDVTEVSKADFDSCSASNPLEPSHTGGLTVITLTSAGRRYFICSSGGHCLNGMKVEINTLSASSPPPSTPPSPLLPPPPTPSVPRPVASPPIKSTAPSPSPKHAHSPKVSPPSPPSKAVAPVSKPSLPPASDPSESGSLSPPTAPAPSSAARFSVIGALICCSGLFLTVLFNL